MTVHLIISGRVQGVGFRQYLRHKARKLGVTGWVTNTKNGTVEAHFQGEKDPVDQMVRIAKRGPFTAQVEAVKVTELTNADPRETFEIIK